MNKYLFTEYFTLSGIEKMKKKKTEKMFKIQILIKMFTHFSSSRENDEWYFFG